MHTSNHAVGGRITVGPCFAEWPHLALAAIDARLLRPSGPRASRAIIRPLARSSAVNGIVANRSNVFSHIHTRTKCRAFRLNNQDPQHPHYWAAKSTSIVLVMVYAVGIGGLARNGRIVNCRNLFSTMVLRFNPKFRLPDVKQSV